MQVERLLQISMAALTALGTLLLGIGERNMTLPVLAMIVAASSVYLTDVKGWLQLNTTVANVAGLIALAVAIHDLDSLRSERQLLSMANLLIYLQFVLLYRQKCIRHYWLLALLSLLQVAVASALNLSMVFGWLLLAYLFLGLTTMALFYVHREHVRFSEPPTGQGRSGRANGPQPAENGRACRRWPLSAVEAGFSGRHASTGDAGVNLAFFRQTSRLACATVVVSIVLFLALPRLGGSTAWRPGNVAVHRIVGFSQSVTLGELGEAFENPEEVMQVTLSDYRTGEVYRVVGEPLFRGALLYSYARGKWHGLAGSAEARPMPVVQDLPMEESLVKQAIRIAPLDDAVLFCIPPAIKHAPNRDLLYLETSEQIVRREERTSSPFHYELITTSLRDHFQSFIAPADRKIEDQEYRILVDTPSVEQGRDPVSDLKRIAATIVQSIPPQQRVERARALESWLRDSGQFQYSLQPVERNPELDPVEDFVTRNRRGHCEYFASALTLMLHSVDIPARMAVGFKGGDWNDMLQFYKVRQLHAHTWVEVYLADQHLPARARESGLYENGGWLTLDPTPSVEEDVAGGWGAYAFNQVADFSQFVWSNYVLGMDLQRQQEAIYQPLVQGIEDTLKRLAEPESRLELLSQWRQTLDPRRWDPADAGRFRWRVLLFAVLALALLVVAASLVSLVVRLALWIAWHRRQKPAGRSPVKVGFYRRLEEVLAQQGLVRSAGQTQREFALSTGGQLAEAPETQAVALLPRRVSEVFYRVRFGHQHLDHDESAAVDQAITELAGALAVRSRRPKPTPWSPARVLTMFLWRLHG